MENVRPTFYMSVGAESQCWDNQEDYDPDAPWIYFEIVEEEPKWQDFGDLSMNMEWIDTDMGLAQRRKFCYHSNYFLFDLTGVK